ncbi:TIGR01777 family oxidoreductase [Corynebacterium pseudopelargi]|uniref:TIGR01777 family oxidoreductase n=1 Tax=Corynebacterium pseudopelargi TaxID=2080757 RepID=UPI000F4DA009
MTLQMSHLVPAPRETVWQWHSRPGAVIRLTPSFLPMTPRTQAENLADGTTIFDLPGGLKWEAKHELAGYVAGYRFTDRCVTAPIATLAKWRHVHVFADAEDDQGQRQWTKITDSLDTRVPKSALTSAFAYRQHQLIQDIEAKNRFDALRKAQGTEDALVIAMTGAGGLVGTALAAQLRTLGHEVIELTRSNPGEGQRLWNPEHPADDLLDGVDVLVHLAGESIMGRFSDAHKQAIYDSRVGPTKRLAQLVKASDRCHTFVSASAIGYYGHDTGDQAMDESDGPGEGFLAKVSKDWEAAALQAQSDSKRVALIRTGIVLSGAGGLLPVMKTLFSVGLGGELEGGKPWFSWIAIDDLCDLYCRAIFDQRAQGPINAVAPNPVRNAEFTEALGQQLNRPTFIPIPSIGPKLLLGEEGAKELALANQLVSANAAEKLGHTFRYPELNQALAHELGGESLVHPPLQ